MKLQIIQLEPYDDVISIRDRLALVSAERVLLLWPLERSPQNAQIVKRKLDLVLIQREAERRQALLALVTAERRVIEYAGDLNISVFSNSRAAQRAGTWKQPLNKVFVDRSDQPADQPNPFELGRIASRLRQLTPAERRGRALWRAGAILLILLTALGIGGLFGPGAEIVIYPAQSQIETAAQLIADPRVTFVDVEQGIVPAAVSVLELESAASIPTTGTTDVPNSLASGRVVFTNQTNDEIIIPAGTVVYGIGRDPARFETVAEATLARGVGSTAVATIRATADSSGTRGNVEPNLIIFIEGPLANIIAVRNPDFTRGGSVRPQGVVTAADYENLKPLAREKLLQVARATFAAQLTGTQFIVPDSVQIVAAAAEEATYSAFVGDPVETLTLTLRTRVRALIVDQQPAQLAARAKLARYIPNGHQLVLESLSYQLGTVRGQDASGRAVFVMSVAGSTAARIDAEGTRQRLAGMTEADALNRLNRDWLLDPLRPPQIVIWPAFMGRLPFLPARITITVKV